MLHPPGFLFFCAGAGGWWPWWPEVEKRLLPSLSVAGGGPFCSSFRCFVHCQEVGAYLLMHIQFFVTPWTVAHQAPLSVGFSRQEYWSGLPRPPPGDLPHPGIQPHLPWRRKATALKHPAPGQGLTLWDKGCVFIRLSIVSDLKMTQ